MVSQEFDRGLHISRAELTRSELRRALPPHVINISDEESEDYDTHLLSKAGVCATVVASRMPERMLSLAHDRPLTNVEALARTAIRASAGMPPRQTQLGDFLRAPPIHDRAPAGGIDATATQTTTRVARPPSALLPTNLGPENDTGPSRLIRLDDSAGRTRIPLSGTYGLIIPEFQPAEQGKIRNVPQRGPPCPQTSIILCRRKVLANREPPAGPHEKSQQRTSRSPILLKFLSNWLSCPTEKYSCNRGTAQSFY